MEEHIKEGAEVALHLKTDRKLRERRGEGREEGRGKEGKWLIPGTQNRTRNEKVHTHLQ